MIQRATPTIAPGEQPLRLRLRNLSGLYGQADGCRFIAIVSREFFDQLDLDTEGSSYQDVEAKAADAREIPSILESFDGRHHVFCVTSDASFRSPSPRAVWRLKLGVLPLYSTGASLHKLRRAIKLLEALDYQGQYAQSRSIIKTLGSADRLVLESREFGTVATLSLWDGPDRIHFFNQSGPLGWGHQSVLPNGEISLLADGHGSFSSTSRFALDGDLVILGLPVVHRGSCPCQIARAGRCTEASDCGLDERHVPRSRLDAVFSDLAELATSGLLLRVRAGVIEDLRPLGRRARGDARGLRRLTQLLADNENYRKVHELGIGLNPWAGFPREGNFLPNEMLRGPHFGLGLTPFTEFHVDLTSPKLDLRVESNSGPGRRLPLTPDWQQAIHQ